ncbi:MAG TPA: hypothetical protein VHM20_07180 [Gammaproteobacteria bacterium]|jgi:hypothetical protein|nr:hypothetical protein [Gammaproteobacteria bacterium]
MRYITPDDFKIFDQEEILDNQVKEAEQRWLKEVEKSHKGLIEYEDTRPLFDVYLEAHNKWKEYFDKHAHILLAQKNTS